MLSSDVEPPCMTEEDGSLFSIYGYILFSVAFLNLCTSTDLLYLDVLFCFFTRDLDNTKLCIVIERNAAVSDKHLSARRTLCDIL